MIILQLLVSQIPFPVGDVSVPSLISYHFKISIKYKLKSVSPEVLIPIENMQWKYEVD